MGPRQGFYILCTHIDPMEMLRPHECEGPSAWVLRRHFHALRCCVRARLSCPAVWPSPRAVVANGAGVHCLCFRGARNGLVHLQSKLTGS